MNTILAVAATGGHTPAFEWTLFVGFVGTFVTFTAWFARYVPKTDRPLAIPLSAFIGVVLVIATLLRGPLSFGAVILSAVAAKEAAAAVGFLRTRAALRKMVHERRWSVDASRMERLFGKTAPLPAERPPRHWRYSPEYRPDQDEDEGDASAQPVG